MDRQRGHTFPSSSANASLLPLQRGTRRPALLRCRNAPPACGAGPVGPRRFVAPGHLCCRCKTCETFSRRSLPQRALGHLSNLKDRAWFRFLFLGLLSSAQKLELNFSFPHKSKKLSPQEGGDPADSFAIIALLHPPYGGQQRAVQENCFLLNSVPRSPAAWQHCRFLHPFHSKASASWCHGACPLGCLVGVRRGADRGKPSPA